MRRIAKGKQLTVRRFGWSDASRDDAQANADAKFTFVVFAVMAALAIVIGSLTHSVAAGLALGVVAIVLSSTASGALHRFIQSLSSGPDKMALKRIAAFPASHPAWSLCLFHTPAGMRVAATQ